MTNITKTSSKSNKKNKSSCLNKYNYRELKKIYTILCKEEPAFQITQEYFFRWAAKFTKMHMSQSTIAQELGLSRETINRVIRRMREYGFLYVWYRPNNTCYYQLPSFWFSLHARKLFGEMFPILALGFQFIFCLLSSPSKEVSASECHTNRIISSSPSLFIYKSSNTLRSNTSLSLRSKNNEAKILTKQILLKKGAPMSLKSLGFKEQDISALAGTYSKETLAAAIQKYKKAKNVNAPLRLFTSICERLAYEENQRKLAASKIAKTGSADAMTLAEEKQLRERIENYDRTTEIEKLAIKVADDPQLLKDNPFLMQVLKHHLLTREKPGNFA